MVFVEGSMEEDKVGEEGFGGGRRWLEEEVEIGIGVSGEGNVFSMG